MAYVWLQSSEQDLNLINWPFIFICESVPDLGLLSGDGHWIQSKSLWITGLGWALQWPGTLWFLKGQDQVIGENARLQLQLHR